MKKLLLLVCAILLLLPIMAEDKKQLTEQEAVDLAKQACIEKGIPAEQIGEGGTATYYEDEDKWSVMLNPKPHESGVYFSWEYPYVSINSDGQVTCSRGS